MTTTAPNVAPAPGTALPCPSPWHDECEEIPAITIHHGDNYAFVGCSCFINGPLRGTEAEAIAAWNKRTPDPALAAENARLIALVGEMREAFEAISQHSGGTQFSTIVGMRKIARALASKAGEK